MRFVAINKLDRIGGAVSTDSNWIRHITERARCLAEWRDSQQEVQRLAEQSIYIRVGGGQFRAVSVHPDNPCGRLKRKEGGKDIGVVKRLGTALKNAIEAAPANTVKVGNNKPEHVVQAGLIHHALRHNLLLNDRFKGFSVFFDELMFVTDELKAGEIRADIIALGRKDAKYFPVFIELKAIRSFERVVEQLIDAQRKMAMAKDSFLDMLASATGKAAHSIVFDDYKLLVAWPETRSGNEKACAFEAVNKSENKSAKGHLLIGQFKRPIVPRDGYNSVIQFGSSA